MTDHEDASPADAVRHLSVAERTEAGKAAQAKTPPSSHAHWIPAANRSSPVSLLEEQAATRVPELVPIRYGRMVSSPFAFYRGAACVMAADLATTPISGLRVQLCGDAHVANFGLFASPERDLVFDINDFDETIAGPLEWDVKRLAASFTIAGRARGLDGKRRREIVRGVVASYREAMATFATSANIEVWYAKLDASMILKAFKQQADRKATKEFDHQVAEAKSRDRMRAFEKLTHNTDGEPRIVSDPPLLVPVSELMPEVERDTLTRSLGSALRSYRRSLQGDRRRLLEGYRLVDVARRVVGVGSVGTRTWVALLLGLDNRDPLFLQFKEARPSVLAPFAGRSPYRNEGQRIVEGQRLMQATSDIFLGWDRIKNREAGWDDYYVRQLWDEKGPTTIETMLPRELLVLGRVCGWTLARAHARSGDRVAIAAYLGMDDAFDRALEQFAEAYADQNEADHRALAEAVDNGRIAAETGL